MLSICQEENTFAIEANETPCTSCLRNLLSILIKHLRISMIETNLSLENYYKRLQKCTCRNETF